MDSLVNLSELDALYGVYVSLSKLEVSESNPQFTVELHNAITTGSDIAPIPDVGGFLYNEDAVALSTEGIIDSTKRTFKKIIEWIRKKLKALIRYIRLAWKKLKEGIFGNNDIIERFSEIPDVTSDDDISSYRVRTDLTNDELKKVKDIATVGISGWLDTLGSFSIAMMEYLPTPDMGNPTKEQHALDEFTIRLRHYIEMVEDINAWTDDVIHSVEENIDRIHADPDTGFTSDVSHPVLLGSRIYTKHNDQPSYKGNNTLLLSYGTIIKTTMKMAYAVPIVLNTDTGDIRPLGERTKLIFGNEPNYKHTVGNYTKAIKEADPFTLYTYLHTLARMIIDQANEMVSIMSSSHYKNTMDTFIIKQQQFEKTVNATATDIMKRTAAPDVGVRGPTLRDRVTKEIITTSRRILYADATVGTGVMYNNIYNRALSDIVNALDDMSKIIFYEN